MAYALENNWNVTRIVLDDSRVRTSLFTPASAPFGYAQDRPLSTSHAKQP